LFLQQGKNYELINVYDIFYIIGGTILFLSVSLVCLPEILNLLKRTSILRSFDEELIGYTLLVCLVIVSLAKLLQVNMVFGALVAGLVIGRLQGLKSGPVKENITSISSWFFVPIYFALVGLQMDLPSSFDGNLIFSFFLFTSIVKILSVALFVKITKESWLNALDFGMTMNARGGPGIVLASVVFSAKIIDEKLFVALVLTSILTSLISGIWLLWRRDVITRDNYFT
jgi:Kef-type K+ transport system membrane component KefB